MFHSNVSCLAVSGMFFHDGSACCLDRGLRPLLLNLYFDSVTKEWKTLQRSPDQNTEINENKKQAIRGQGQNKRAESVLEQCKENHLSEHKGREPGGTSASLDCGPK